MKPGKKIYFASDFHLGVPTYEKSLEREHKIVKWLDSIKADAEELYLLGDVFDFWFEYRTVVPRGYVRLLGKLAELSDSGIKIHYFTGNHDMWTFDYLEKELTTVKRFTLATAMDLVRVIMDTNSLKRFLQVKFVNGSSQDCIRISELE